MHSPSLFALAGGELATETKFVVSRAAAAEIRQWARQHLTADAHGTGPDGDGYRITTLYLDTPNLDVFHRTGSHGRTKYRLRRYADGDVVYLERKVKSQGRITKRRTAVPLDELGCLASHQPRLRWPGYWFHRRVLARQVQPVCQLSYQRTARMAVVDGATIRLTLDESLSAWAVAEYRFCPDAQGLPLLGDNVILEMKYLNSIPRLFFDLVSEFRLSPEPASKYRRAGALFVPAPESHA
ncbi:MAG: polyphosphate polymerase domain-containing protein [Bryobacteraceae bacterium]